MRLPRTWWRLSPFRRRARRKWRRSMPRRSCSSRHTLWSRSSRMWQRLWAWTSALLRLFAGRSELLFCNQPEEPAKHDRARTFSLLLVWFFISKERKKERKKETMEAAEGLFVGAWQARQRWKTTNKQTNKQEKRGKTSTHIHNCVDGSGHDWRCGWQCADV